MSGPEYTPGPLTVEPNEHDHAIHDATGRYLGAAETAADAKLWSASPRLAETLKRVIDRAATVLEQSYPPDRDLPAWQNLRAELDKAQTELEEAGVA